MELIDKQKLLEWIKAENGKVSDPAGGEAYILFYLREHIESGTFDDHSAQEEVAKLKETFASEVNRLESELEKCHTHGLRLSSRAIQAEQERDALLEAWKQFARPIPSSYAEIAPVTFACSIIAKIERK